METLTITLQVQNKYDLYYDFNYCLFPLSSDERHNLMSKLHPCGRSRGEMST